MLVVASQLVVVLASMVLALQWVVEWVLMVEGWAWMPVEREWVGQ